jgi:hypothetical protein
MKGKVVLFGLNYAHCKQGKLNGCINDVYAMTKYLQSTFGLPVEVYTDDVDKINTSYNGIIEVLSKLSRDTYNLNLDYVWIHYSGHGSSKKDISGDEIDGIDEGLVPSDYETKGIIIDDILYKILSLFNPKTKIIFICDACHSGSILDLNYSWQSNKQCHIENRSCELKSKTILISGCKDNQTSADAYNLLNDGKHIGALSACILNTLKNKPEKIHNVFSLINTIRKELTKKGYKQYPCLSTNFDLSENISLFPLNNENNKQEQLYKHNVNENSINQQNYNNHNNKYIYQQPINVQNLPRIGFTRYGNITIPPKILRRSSSATIEYAPTIHTKQNNTTVLNSSFIKNNEYHTFVGYYL